MRSCGLRNRGRVGVLRSGVSTGPTSLPLPAFLEVSSMVLVPVLLISLVHIAPSGGGGTPADGLTLYGGQAASSGLLKFPPSYLRQV